LSPVEFGDVGVYGDVGPVVGKDAACGFVDFAHGDDGVAGTFQPEVHAANTGE
jgi:hypothetical protein